MPDKIEEIYVPLSKINELPEVPYQNVKELGNAIETTYVPDVNAILFIRWDFNYEGTSGFDNLAYGPSRLLDPNLERLREELRDTIDEILGNFDVIETKPTIGHNNPPEPIAEEVALVTDLSVIKKEISDALPDTDKATAYRVVISKYVSLFTEKLTAGIADSLAKATVAGVLLLLAKLSGLFDVLMQFLQQR